MSPSDPLAVALDALQSRLTRVFPEQIRACLDQLTDEQLWWRPNEQSNSVGNIVLHLIGSLDHYLNRNLGGFDFTRDRAAEFADRGPIPNAELRARFDAMVARATRTLDRLTADGLADRSPEPKMHSIILEDLLNAGMHLSNHAGQITWITKLVRGVDLDNLWIVTHKEQGAWKR